MARLTLKEYLQKRDFMRTTEPTASRAKSRKGKQKTSVFVVQKHAARRLHYDFRLEIDGVLVSWAVPKGPSLDPADKRLAVRTEDHPLEYAQFEGTIPEGEYGAGTVMIWDQGTYVPEGDPIKGLEEGKLTFRLNGKRLKGGFTLVRLRGPRSDGGKNWLLIKERDEYANGNDIIEREMTSTKSGRSMEEIAARSRGNRTLAEGATARKAASRSSKPTRRASTERMRAKVLRAKSTARKAEAAGALPQFLPPELATLIEEPPEGEGWLHEIKYDGYRIIAAVAGDQVRLYTRHGKDWTERFRPLVEPLQKLRFKSALLDGEVVVMDESGRTDFGALQRAMEEGNKNLTYVVFDLLQLDGEDLRPLPLRERKALLEKLLGNAAKRGPIRFSEHSQGNGRQAFARACRRGFEGIVSKRANALYRSGERTRDWLKVKCVAEQEFVIGGWSESDRGRPFASLLLGTWQKGELHYSGRVGTGYDEHDLQEIRKKLRALELDQSPFVDVPRVIRRRAHWVKPVLVAQVRYTELTRDGIVRHGVFEGLREDKLAQEVTMERPRERPGK
jgi:bifunctional non-homologous end joining protein LigD